MLDSHCSGQNEIGQCWTAIVRDKMKLGVLFLSFFCWEPSWTGLETECSNFQFRDIHLSERKLDVHFSPFLTPARGPAASVQCWTAIVRDKMKLGVLFLLGAVMDWIGNGMFQFSISGHPSFGAKAGCPFLTPARGPAASAAAACSPGRQARVRNGLGMCPSRTAATEKMRHGL